MTVQDIMMRADAAKIQAIIMQTAELSNDMASDVTRRMSALYDRMMTVSGTVDMLMLGAAHGYSDAVWAIVAKLTTGDDGKTVIGESFTLAQYVLMQGGATDEVVSTVVRMQVSGPNVQAVGCEALCASIIFWLAMADYDALVALLKQK